MNHNPDPRLIADDIAAALSHVPFVRAIALFGSLAAGSADAYSDVDMLVACDDVEATKWTVAAALRKAKPVLFYRKFTAAEQPSGRYWFVGESPFHKLDISFDPIEDYARVIRDGGRLGHKITAHEVYRRLEPSVTTSGAMPGRPLIIDEREWEVGLSIYRSLLSLKSCLRGGDGTRGFDELREAAMELPRDAVMAGGNVGQLVHEVVEMVQRELRVVGGVSDADCGA
jgi:predicted nucleotidyltransferase